MPEPKTKAKNRVEKMLSPEEKALLSNIKSMVTELEQLDGGEIAMADGDKIDVDIMPEEEEDKVVAAKSQEGATASDDADKRKDEDLPDTTKENVDAVKALVFRMDRKLRKSQTSDRSIVQALDGVTKAIKIIAARQDEQELALKNLFEGMGLSEQIEKSIKPKTEKPVQSTDTAKVLKELLGVADKVEKKEQPKTLGEVRKSLASRNVMTALLGPK